MSFDKRLYSAGKYKLFRAEDNVQVYYIVEDWDKDLAIVVDWDLSDEEETDLVEAFQWGVLDFYANEGQWQPTDVVYRGLFNKQPLAVTGYFVDFGTGAGNKYADTLEEAKMLADKCAAYTQKDIRIVDRSTGEAVAVRRWYGVKYDPDEAEQDDPIEFGDSGFYGDWESISEKAIKEN